MIVMLLLGLTAGLLAGGLGHVVGTTPLLGALLCAACLFRTRDVAIMGLVGIIFRDAVLGLSWFTVVRVMAILSVVGIVTALRVRPSIKSLLLGLGVSAPVFHLVLAFGDWVTQTCSKEPWNFSGLRNTLMGSLPYFQTSLIGDLAFTAAFVGLYTLTGYLLTMRWPTLIPQLSRE